MGINFVVICKIMALRYVSMWLWLCTVKMLSGDHENVSHLYILTDMRTPSCQHNTSHVCHMYVEECNRWQILSADGLVRAFLFLGLLGFIFVKQLSHNPFCLHHFNKFTFPKTIPTPSSSVSIACAWFPPSFSLSV